MNIPLPPHGRRRGPRRFGPGGYAEGGIPIGFQAGDDYHDDDGPPPFPPGPHAPHAPHAEGGPGFGPGFQPGGRGRGMRRGPGRGGPGFGPDLPGFADLAGFGFARGPRGPRGRGERGRRGNVRASVLALLAEEPRHGYAIMNELAERSGGLWRPSPGSVYPVLQQLQDEGLVLVEEADGRRIFTLSEAGRAYVAEHAGEMDEPWRVAENGPMQRAQSIMFSVKSLGAAAAQVARLADDEQAAKAVVVLDDARRALYRILAGETE